VRKPKSENRSIYQLKEHYDIEKELALRLLKATKEERQKLYTSLYDELFERVKHHPMLTGKADPASQAKRNARQLKLLKKFINKDSRFLEIGPGDGSFSLEVAKHVKTVAAIDVSNKITSKITPPENLELLISDGSSIPLPDNSINVAFSNNLFEHLHPDDAMDHLLHINRVLVKGGTYICMTLNRLNGPHDISKYFDKVAKGFHLKEYTNFELEKMFKTAGFSKTTILVGARGIAFSMPVFPVKMVEKMLISLPSALCCKISSFLPIKILLGIKFVAVK
jgi:cyclopropane fatty-acyl-phospholipid synthase-like methyltransferase